MSQELAERTTGGIVVRLLWNSEQDTVEVEYLDLHTGDTFTAPVPKTEALEAFEHPNVYRVGG